MITNSGYAVNGHSLELERQPRYDEMKMIGGDSKRLFQGIDVRVECRYCEQELSLDNCSRENADSFLKYFIGAFAEYSCGEESVMIGMPSNL